MKFSIFKLESLKMSKVYVVDKLKYNNLSLLQIVTKAIRDYDYPVLKDLLNLNKSSITGTEEFIILNNLPFIAKFIDYDFISDWLRYNDKFTSKNTVITENIARYDYMSNTTYNYAFGCRNMYILNHATSEFIYYKFTYDYKDLKLSIYNSSEDPFISFYLSEINNCLMLYIKSECTKVLIDLITDYIIIKDCYLACKHQGYGDVVIYDISYTYKLLQFEFK